MDIYHALSEYLYYGKVFRARKGKGCAEVIVTVTSEELWNLKLGKGRATIPYFYSILYFVFKGSLIYLMKWYWDYRFYSERYSLLEK